MFSNSLTAAFVAVAIGVTAFDKIGGERESDFKGRARVVEVYKARVQQIYKRTDVIYHGGTVPVGLSLVADGPNAKSAPDKQQGEPNAEIDQLRKRVDEIQRKFSMTLDSTIISPTTGEVFLVFSDPYAESRLGKIPVVVKGNEADDDHVRFDKVVAESCANYYENRLKEGTLTPAPTPTPRPAPSPFERPSGLIW
jgi:hypothetical protein